jgi:hypothetical protein
MTTGTPRDTHTRVMAENTILYGDAITRSTARRGEISISYTVFYMKILAYGAPATSMSYKECPNMQKPVINTILPNMGINRNAA